MPRLACWPLRHSALTATTSTNLKESPWKGKALHAKSPQHLSMAPKQGVAAIGCLGKARVLIPCPSAVGTPWRFHPLAERHPRLSQKGFSLLSLRAKHHSCLSKRCLLLSLTLLKHVPKLKFEQLWDGLPAADQWIHVSMPLFLSSLAGIDRYIASSVPTCIAMQCSAGFRHIHLA